MTLFTMRSALRAKAMRNIAAILVFAAAVQGGGQDSAAGPVSIHVDLAKPIGVYSPISSWFGYDESNYTTMKYGEQLLSELHDLSPVPVNIRAHHLLTSGNGVAELKWSSSNVFSLDEDGKPVYDFTITDRTFDEYMRAGVRPMVELGFMPKDLAATVPGITEYQLHYPKPTMGGASNNPPKDYKMWGELVRHYVAHLVERYGRQQVSTWYFEVWNEPDISYWHGTPEEYFKLYDYRRSGREGGVARCEGGRAGEHGTKRRERWRVSRSLFATLPARQERRDRWTDSARLHFVSSQRSTGSGGWPCPHGDLE